MDSISLLVGGGPAPNANRALTQDDFDARYNFVKFRKKKTNGELLRQYTIGENWQLYQPPNSWAQLFPISLWIQKYHVKDSLWRDLLGALFLSALLIPQSISYGTVIDNIPVAMFSLYVPQIVYTFFGSAQHSSLGAMSFTSMMIYSSMTHSKSPIAMISLCCAVIQLLQFLLPLEFIFSYISTSSLSGFSLGLVARIVARLFSQFIIFRGQDCKPATLPSPNVTLAAVAANATLSRPLQCFYAAMPCLRAADPLLIGVTVAAAILFIVFKWRATRLISERCGGFSVPHEMVILSVAVATLWFFGAEIASATARPPLDFSIPAIRFWRLPSVATWLDSFAISMYTMTAHMSITKSIAVEKMYKVHRKQELLCFSIISFISSLFGLLPPSSGYGSSQLNIESSKFSLVANVLSLIPTTLVIQFGAPLFNVLPMCAVGVMVLCSLNGWFSDLKSIRETFYASTWDAGLALCALLAALLIPNTCHAFLTLLACQIFAVSLRVQFPPIEVLSKLGGDTHFAEELRYEGIDCLLDTPMRIIRLAGPLLSVNCEAIRNEMFRQAIIVKGLIGIGIGTRTASLRSQCPSAIGPKFSLQESVTARESVGLSANITIIQECDVSVALPTGDEPPPIVRFLVLTFNGVNAIDKDMLTCLSQIYGDLNSDNIKCLFTGVPARIRDQMEHLAFFNIVPKTAFFPNLQEALICARNTVAPFHMSVSMNGYRDVIALSCAQSNADLNRVSPEAV